MMTKEELIEMAKEAGIDIGIWEKLSDNDDVFGYDFCGIHENLEAFAKLVAKHTLLNTDPNSFMSYQEGVEVGRLAEREACAKVCDAMEEKAEGTECCKWPTPIDCAHAIRARGEKA